MKNNKLKTALSKFPIDSDIEIINPETIRGGTNNCTTKAKCSTKGACIIRMNPLPKPDFDIVVETSL